MHLTLIVEGGFAYFPGLRHPLMVRSEALPHREATRLAKLITASKFFDLPQDLTSRNRGSADFQAYHLTIRDGVREHSVTFADPINNEALGELVDFIQSHTEPTLDGEG